MDNLSGVRHIVLVLSGKGGVGKSSVTTQLALSLARRPIDGGSRKPRIGVLDIDLTGPSLPRMFGLEGCAIHQAQGGWVPVTIDRNDVLIRCMSIGFLLKDRGDAVVWRGPKKTAMVRQFLTDVVWGDLDYLLVDTPPGTSDEHLSIVEKLRDIGIDGAVLVTTPQEVSLGDVRRELSFCEKVGVKALGLIENMSGYSCPCCGEVTHVFARGGGERLAEERGVPFLGSVPIDSAFVERVETQPQGPTPTEQTLIEWYPTSHLAETFAKVARRVAETIERNIQQPASTANAA
ncbi:cytosolic Fe-S cluster assembly factor cfd1 [Savitreella phatthalungensis]